jgi:hypothetical protein
MKQVPLRSRQYEFVAVDVLEYGRGARVGLQDALGHLSKRKLIAVEREGITAVPVYTVLRPWRR